MTGRIALDIHSMFPLEAYRPAREEMCMQPNIMKGSNRGPREHGRQEPDQTGSNREVFLEEVMADLCLKK